MVCMVSVHLKHNLVVTLAFWGGGGGGKRTSMEMMVAYHFWKKLIMWAS